MNKFQGLFSALLVSFNEDGSLNEQGIRDVVRHNIDKMKVNGLYVGGSTGENFMLSSDEKKEIFRIAKDEAGDAVTLIAQVGSVNVQESCELGKYALELGYDCLSAVTPFYYKFSFDEVKEYYDTIIRETGGKMIIYSIPFLTGVNMGVEQFGKLYENKNIIGVKFTAGDFYLLERLKKAYPNHLLFSGFDEMMLPACAVGVDGAIGSTFNVVGHLAREVFESANNGDFATARKVQSHMNDFIEQVLSNGLYLTLKEILHLQGCDISYCRQPMTQSLTDAQRAKAKELFEKFCK